MGRNRKYTKVGYYDEIPCACGCGSNMFVHKGEFYGSEECLARQLETEKEEKDLVQEWRERNL